MSEPSKEFRAGWEATCDHMDGVGNYAEEAYERHLQNAWDEYLASQPKLPAGTPQEAEEFVNDWNSMIATISEFALKNSMQYPEMIFHPQWLERMNYFSTVRIGSTIINRGVKVRFGTWESISAFRIA